MNSVLGGLQFVQQGAEDALQRKRQAEADAMQRESFGMKQQQFGQEQKQQQLTELSQMARYLSNLPPQSRAVAYASMRPKLDPIAQSFGLPPAPEVWSEEHLPELQQLANLGQQQANWQNLGNGYVMGPSGEVKQAFEPPQKSRARPVNVPDGNGGSVMMLFDPDTQQLSPLNFDGQEQQNKVQFDFTPDMPPEAQAAARAAAGVLDPGAVEVAGGVTQAPARAQAFGGLGYKPPRAPAARDTERAPPQGYRWNADHTRQEVIPGGPADRSSPTSGARSVKDPTEDQSKAAGWYISSKNALKNLREAIQSDPSALTPGLTEAYVPVDEVKQRSMSGTRQRAEQALNTMKMDFLHAATGAGFTQQEAADEWRNLAPQRGNSKELIDQKLKQIEVKLESMRVRAGRALPPTSAAPAPNAPPAAAAPKRLKFNPATGRLE